MRWIKTTYVLSWYKKETLVYLQTSTRERKYLQSKSKKITDDVTVFNVKTATTKIASKITSDLISAKRTIDIGVLLELRLWHKHIQSLMLGVAFPVSHLFFSRISNVGFHAHTCQSLVQFQHFKLNRLSFFVVASFVSFRVLFCFTDTFPCRNCHIILAMKVR